MLAVSVLAALAQGSTMPLLTLLFGSIIDVFIHHQLGLIGQQEFDDGITKNVMNFMYG